MDPKPLLVVEWHYTDGDVGAHLTSNLSPQESRAVLLLWQSFAGKSEQADRIVIRHPGTEEVKE